MISHMPVSSAGRSQEHPAAAARAQQARQEGEAGVQEEHLVPLVRSMVPRVDLKAGVLFLDLPPGLPIGAGLQLLD